MTKNLLMLRSLFKQNQKWRVDLFSKFSIDVYQNCFIKPLSPHKETIYLIKTINWLNILRKWRVSVWESFSSGTDAIDIKTKCSRNLNRWNFNLWFCCLLYTYFKSSQLFVTVKDLMQDDTERLRKFLRQIRTCLLLAQRQQLWTLFDPNLLHFQDSRNNGNERGGWL